MLNRLNYTKDNLETLTFATCVIGGAYWTSKYFKKLNNESRLCQVSSMNAVLGVFYAYLALNVNNFLIYSELVGANILYKGYLTVYGVLLADIGQDIYSYWKSKTK